MNIRDVKTYRLDAALAEPFAYSQAWYEHRGALLVEIISDDGLSGWGEAFGPPLLTAPIVEFYKTLLVNTDPLATELHWQNLYNRLRDHGQKGLAIEALSAIDVFVRIGRQETRCGAVHHESFTLYFLRRVLASFGFRFSETCERLDARWR
jgi:L-alanine-DL-glutamate epimerase-like enolase superfamily enzyme